MMMRLALIGGANAAVYGTVGIRMPQVTFSAVADRDAGVAKKAAAQLGAAVTARSLDELLAGDDGAFDAVVIHQPAASAEGSAVKAAQAGKHVLAASPLAASSRGADAVIESCRTAGVTLMAGHSLRFMPSQKTVKAAVAAGKLGDAGLLRIHVWQSSQGDSKEILMTQAVDSLDLAVWMFAGLPTEIYTIGRSGYVQVHLGFPEGGMALIDYALTLPRGDDYFSMSLIGSTGAAYADDHHNRNLLYAGGVPSAIETNEGHFAFTEQLREFRDAVEEKRPPSVTGEDGKKALQVAEAAVTSLEKSGAMKRTGGGYELN